MPSIFDHENACWGVKKPYSNLLNCDIDNGEPRPCKIGLLKDTLPNSSNSVKFSVSSNGYYGYQPHSSVSSQFEPCGNNAMDIDVDHIPASQFPQNGKESKPFVFSSSCFESINRKRQMSGYSLENNKRMRQQDVAEISPQTSTCNSHQSDGVGSRLRLLGGQLSGEGKKETTAELLRLTHGCEVYLYERSCDY